MRTLKWILIVMVIIVGIFAIPTKIAVAESSTAEPTWSRFIWPLCGRIKEESGNNWKIGKNIVDNCDYVTRIEQQGKTDFPIDYGFGYRNFEDTSRAISFHRGLDLATPGNTHNKDADNPVFAAAGGIVKSVTCHKNGQTDADLDNKPENCLSARDQKVVLLHPANGASECSTTNPCLISVYNHVRVQDVNSIPPIVKTDLKVVKGQHIAWTGTSREGNFDHLHFEIRDPYERARAANKKTSGASSFAKDARNPMFYLPYPVLNNPEPLNIEISETSSVSTPDVDVWVNLSANPNYNLNLKSIQVRPTYRDNNGTHQRAFVPTSRTCGTNVKEYVVNNSLFDVDEWSVQHTPFPSTSTTLWSTEKNENPYFNNIDSTEPDQFLEKNASTTIQPNGHRYADFDFKLITAGRRNDNSTGNEWYTLNVGFTGIEAAPVGATRCYEVEVVTAYPNPITSSKFTRLNQTRTVTQCFS
ncbi:hypothetical protein NUACC21_81500 [Scytonema sp. NUACC21]